MKNRHFPSKIEDQICDTRSAIPPIDGHRSGAAGFSRPEHFRVSYVHGECIRAEPAELPRLFIQGCGGSVKMDLSGIGIELSPRAFAFTMPDESLSRSHIHRGDLAIVQPLYRALREGDFLLVIVDGKDTLRQITKRKRIWYLQTGCENNAKAEPLWDWPFYGVVVGFLRIFENLRPVNYRRSAKQFDLTWETRAVDGRASKSRGRSNPESTHRKRPCSVRKQTPSFLAAEAGGAPRFSERDNSTPHS